MAAPEKEAEATDQVDSAHLIKFEVYGQEMIVKRVKPSGNSGRVYLPYEWVAKKVSIIRVE